MRVGIMGIGLMGRAFAERFHAEGWTVGLFNRCAERIDDLREKGFECFSQPEEFLLSHDTLILMAANADAIRALLQLDQPGTDLAGKTVLQMATISPGQSRDIAEQVRSRGGRYLEAPVLGSLPEARGGSLIIMAGGDEVLFAEMLPLLRVLGGSIRRIGDVGSGAALKLAMNQLIAALTAGFSLSLAYARENDVDVDLFMDTVRDSALYARTYDKKLDKYLSREFGAANFSTRHLLKDIRLFLEDASARGLATGALAGIEEIAARTVAAGFDSSDYSSIYQIIHPD